MVYLGEHGKTRGHVPPLTHCPTKPAMTTYDPRGPGEIGHKQENRHKSLFVEKDFFSGAWRVPFPIEVLGLGGIQMMHLKGPYK